MGAREVWMVPPGGIGFNDETKHSNVFQTHKEDLSASIFEFDNLVDSLDRAGVGVTLLRPSQFGPDSHFPNNWISTHAPGILVTYPMLSPTRRLERDAGVVQWILENYVVDKQLDYTHFELDHRYMEGTGSLVFDPTRPLVFACRSPRNDESLVRQIASELCCEAVIFDAKDEAGRPYYHTNVVLSLGSRLCVACLESFDASTADTLKEHRDVIAVSREQVHHFCGNILELESSFGHLVVAMSESAWSAFEPSQKALIESLAQPVVVSVPTIEAVGGGSVRCMIAENYLSRR